MRMTAYLLAVLGLTGGWAVLDPSARGEGSCVLTAAESARVCGKAEPCNSKLLERACNDTGNKPCKGRDKKDCHGDCQGCSETKLLTYRCTYTNTEGFDLFECETDTETVGDGVFRCGHERRNTRCKWADQMGATAAHCYCFGKNKRGRTCSLDVNKTVAKECDKQDPPKPIPPSK